MTRDFIDRYITEKYQHSLQEISKNKLVNYMSKAKKNLDGWDKKYKKGDYTDDDIKKLDRRISGTQMASDKFYGRAKVAPSGKDKAFDFAQKVLVRKSEARKPSRNIPKPKLVKEEDLQEISRELAGKYIQKASSNMVTHARLDGDFSRKAYDNRKKKIGTSYDNIARHHSDKVEKRAAGIDLAAKKLTAKKVKTKNSKTGVRVSAS